MEELVDDFIDANLGPEMAAEVRRALNLCTFFNVEDVYDRLIDIIVLEGIEQPDGIRDGFYEALIDTLRGILKAHTIVLAEEATLEQINELLTALARIQYREDYSNYLRILEGTESDIEQFTEIMSDLCELDQVSLLDLIVAFDSSTIDVLKQYMYNKEEENTELKEENKELRKQLQLFFKADEKKESIGSQLAETGMLVSVPFHVYIPYIHEVLEEEKSPAKLALHILSVLYMSTDGYQNPLELYRQHSIELLGDINRTSAVEVRLLEMLSSFNDFVKAENEKARLSQTTIA